jgi:hypothetical protein
MFESLQLNRKTRVDTRGEGDARRHVRPPFFRSPRENGLARVSSRSLAQKEQ